MLVSIVCQSICFYLLILITREEVSVVEIEYNATVMMNFIIDTETCMQK